MREYIQKNVDVFAWSAADMSGIDADVVCHRLNMDPKTRPIRQKMRIIATKLEESIHEEVKKLLDAGFISEIQYPSWVSKVVMVKKGDGRWRMLSPDSDASPDVKDVSFITREGCFSYKMMSFGLKNAGATYQCMMDRVFKNQRGRNLEVYVDDLIVKSRDVGSQLLDLGETFVTLRKFKMRLNPQKCVFGASRGMFLGHLLTPAKVEPNPNKVRAIVELASPHNAKEVKRLTGKLAGLSRFLSRVGEKCSPFFKALRGNQKFEWTGECKEAFRALKAQLSQAPLHQNPKEGEDLALYLGVGEEAVSSVLVEHSGQLAKWSIELSEFDVSFVPRLSIKAQAVADFLADYIVELEEEETPSREA
ncbi:hypothetical protein KSP39_PZI024498 [Platanthera zijinensis]|uniref:Reverse transcriptase domain-containing protein n=1 Tax=Platanthera zijinensis TaxID=2320716 RepID=A0AAP0ATE7_9ASPA